MATTLAKAQSVEKRKTKWRQHKTFNTYIYKVLKQIYPGNRIGITKFSMKILNSLIDDLLIRIGSESRTLLRMCNRTTLDMRCMESATKLVLIAALQKHAVTAAQKAVNTYVAYKHNSKHKAMSHANEKRKRKSKKAGLLLPVGRIAKELKFRGYSTRVGDLACIYLTAVLEYMIAEVIEVSGKVASKMKKQRITPLHICIAIRNDEELSMLFHEITIPQAGGAVVDSSCLRT